MMKQAAIFIVLNAVMVTGLAAQQVSFPHLTGPYLGQTPPESGKELFAPGIISTEAGNHSSVAISPDGLEMYWTVRGKIWSTTLEDGWWTEPEMVPFCEGDLHMYDNPFITPDGSKMFFTSFRPGAVAQEHKETIWYVQRTSSGWSDPEPISSEVNMMPLHWSVSVSDGGTLYFQGTRDGDYGGGDIYYSELVDGAYAGPVNIGPELNSSATETCPHIAPDGSYVVFTRFDETNEKNTGIFISYRDESGAWLPPVLVAGGRRGAGGLSPRISPDGEYLFFVNGSDGMWWMPAGFVEALRPTDGTR
jgi:Tol biopolymer transport system component